MDTFLEIWVWIHRLIGYPTAFVLGPLALLTFAGMRVHRRWGKLFVLAMMFLYASGTVFTFHHHPLGSLEFWRNITFNLAGIMTVMLGLAAALQMTHDHEDAPRFRLAEWMFLAVLAASSLGMIGVGFKRFPMLVIGVIGVVIAWRSMDELRQSPPEPGALLRRHIRYMVAGYFYLLTLLSLLHLRDWPQALRWLWPALIGVPVALALTGDWHRRWNLRRSQLTRWAVWATVAVAMLFGAYILVSVIAPAGASAVRAGR